MDIVESINRFLSGAEPGKGVRTRMTKARDEIARLREWIREEGKRADVCTYNVLGEICEGCQCHRSKLPNTQD